MIEIFQKERANIINFSRNNEIIERVMQYLLKSLREIISASRN